MFDKNLEVEDLTNNTKDAGNKDKVLDGVETEEMMNLEESVSSTVRELAQLKENMLRVVAEQENLRKRHEREMEDTYKFAVGSFAKDLLNVADNLERALSACAEKSDSMYKGIEMTLNELMRIFSEFGITPIDQDQVDFDHSIHHAIKEVSTEDQLLNGKVASILQKGYKIHNRVLRAAMVEVYKI